ncbi:MAG TPA: Crp/Fnr family transcriptional regulator [Sphingomonas sp.]|nr:Crp/Fnr family transcriptional regulator [Sphingomonas sp.]
MTDADLAALQGLPVRQQVFEAGRYIVREGSSPDHSALILSGIAYRHKVTVDGARQIVAMHIAGDFVDLEGALLRVADHNVQALTRCEVALVPTNALRALLDAHSNLAVAMWIDTLIDGSIFREWIVNVGRRDARARIAHLLCEFARRLEVAGLADPGGYQLPMTQEQLADATGLTAVHVNRTLKALERDGLVVRHRRFVDIPVWQHLRDVAGFNELYLHLDQVAA